MKRKIEKEMKKTKEMIKAFMKYTRLSIRDMQKYFKEGDFANAKIEAEDAVDLLMWISQELEVLARLEKISEDENR